MYEGDKDVFAGWVVRGGTPFSCAQASILTQCMFEGGKKAVKYLRAGWVAGWGALPLCLYKWSDWIHAC
jgi:hypothetical protein